MLDQVAKEPLRRRPLQWRSGGRPSQQVTFEFQSWNNLRDLKAAEPRLRVGCISLSHVTMLYIGDNNGGTYGNIYTIWGLFWFSDQIYSFAHVFINRDFSLTSSHFLGPNLVLGFSKMDHTSSPPIVLSMDVSSRDDSDYRILVQNRVRYLTIRVGTLDRSTLSIPLSSLSEFPDDSTWNMADVSRDPSSSDIRMNLHHKTFNGITDLWYPVLVDCLDLKKTKLLTATAYEATYFAEGKSSIY